MNAIASPRLSDLLKGIATVAPMEDMPIAGISADSRRIEPGWLFLAAPGTRADGRAFIAGALARGAAAIVYEHAELPLQVPVPAIPVHGLSARIGEIADRYFGSPSQQLFVVGVTGTNGKTTCTHLLAQVLDQPEGRCGLIGTLGAGYPEALDPATHTTPDAISVHGLLSGFARSGAASVCMEVSSHALDQGRVQGVAFDVAVFTNLTRDHLDYHGSMHHYAAAKTRLFEFAGLRAAVINRDDELGRVLIEKAAQRIKVVSFGFEQGDVRATQVIPATDGLTLDVATPVGAVTLHSPLLGRFNAANLLAVLAVLLESGMDLQQAAARLSRARPVAGRMERFGGGAARPLVVVDYAHTPDALQQALAALREHTRGRLWCVFGCGGDRDRGKRPLMGGIAERLADVVVLTDDNPRHEPAQRIIDDILAGMQTTPTVVRERSHAIHLALREAKSDDVVLIAGKGHENYQQVGDQRHAYSDRAVVQELLGEAA
jgi:UDP-N-acetylmuramoyl-L-alanyl-D-glutamate--2,6-diaminopimelate ligase